MQKTRKRGFKIHHQPAGSLEFIKILLPAIGTGANAEQCQGFLDYVHEELEPLGQYPGSYAIIDSRKQLLSVVAEFGKTSEITRDQAISIVSSVAGSACVSGAVTMQESFYYSSVELVLRIWANVHVQIPRQTPMFTPIQTVIPWSDNITFQSLVSTHFEERKGRPATNLKIIDSKLSMAFLAKVYKFRVIWTSNLADHLKMDPKSPGQIMVYEHKICLWNHLSMAQDRNNVPVLPLPLVEEAIDTLNLLFPFGRKSTKSFLRHHGKSFHGLGTCGRATQYDTQEYHYWRKEVGELAEVLSQQPRGRAQFILNKDGTNTLVFWTFWTAVVFGMLGTIGATTGVYSAIYAKKAFDVGVLQYQLALAQACSVLNATDLLPGFCH